MNERDIVNLGDDTNEREVANISEDINVGNDGNETQTKESM